MSTGRVVNEVLFGKTELKSEKVELSVVDAFEKAYQEALKSQERGELMLIDAADKIQQSMKVLNKAGSDFLRANSLYQDIENMAKELGVDPSSQLRSKKENVSVAIKEIDKLINKAKQSIKIGDI